jgi:hypothetical protein
MIHKEASSLVVIYGPSGGEDVVSTPASSEFVFCHL